MVTISDELLCLFSGRVEEQDGSYVVEIPEQELSQGQVQERNTYRVALFPTPDSADTEIGSESPSQTRSQQGRQDSVPEPPVTEGEQKTVEIVDIGDQGDGIARVDRGYVIIIPDTELGEEVEIEITTVKENLAFAEVEERISYYD